jgi:hypothetical protein
LTEAERLQRWERRLAWEQLGEEERALRYRELAARNALGALGLGGGFWGRRFGGLDLDLTYLRSVPIRRGLFETPYRSRFSRYPRSFHDIARVSSICERMLSPNLSRFRADLARRYSPHFTRRGPRAFDPVLSVPTQYLRSSPPLSEGSGLHEQELRNRLRIAELRGVPSPLLSSSFGFQPCSDRAW